MILAIFLSVFSLLLAALPAAMGASSYDYRLGNPALWHSEITYCPTNSYLTRKYVGYTSGFVPVAAIVDTPSSTYGYIGVQSSISAIVVTFRGSQDFNNWITNLDAVTTTYPYCSGCAVHKGFSDAEKKVFPDILTQVKSLQAKYPSYTVLATGHSLGAALATLTAFDLIHNGIKNVKLFNYGSPRVGNTAFADWASTNKIITRQTHYKVNFPSP